MSISTGLKSNRRHIWASMQYSHFQNASEIFVHYLNRNLKSPDNISSPSIKLQKPQTPPSFWLSSSCSFWKFSVILFLMINISSQNENKATMRVPLFQVESAIMCLLKISGCSAGSIKSPSNMCEGVILIWECYPPPSWLVLLCRCAGYKLLIFLKSALHEVKKKGLW